MTRGWVTGAVLRAMRSQDGAAFARFERDNREAHERFNEPQPDVYYGDQGLHEAFNELLELERRGLAIARVVSEQAGDRWWGRGVLIRCGEGVDASALLAYQTDRQHLGRGVASALMAELIASARTLGTPGVLAVVTQDNTVSRHLLVRSGFQCLGDTEPAHLRHGVASCLLFRLVL